MSKGNGTTIGYRIQFRSTLAAKVVGKQIVTEKWSDMLVDRGAIGVPNNLWCPLADQNGLLTYEAAMALTAWAAASGGMWDLEFRLVKHEMTYQYAIREMGVGDPMNFSEMQRAATFTGASGDTTEIALAKQ